MQSVHVRRGAFELVIDAPDEVARCALARYTGAMALLRGLFVSLFFLAPLAACSPSPTTVYVMNEPAPTADASADSGVRTDAASAPSFGGDAQAKTPTGSECERDLTVGKLTISTASCFVNQHVENKKTKLAFACGGGKATATFDGHVFTGTITADETISLQNVEPFVFNSCNWISTERIEGDLRKGNVTYTYSERPETTCRDAPCTAAGNLDVEAGEVVVVR